MVKLLSIAALPEYRLQLEYSDGVTGEVDLSHLVGKGVFSVWSDPTKFNAVIIGDHGELKWSDEIDMCADAMYLEVTGKSVEDLFPNLKAHADA
jgi:hypothetical protein